MQQWLPSFNRSTFPPSPLLVKALLEEAEAKLRAIHRQGVVATAEAVATWKTFHKAQQRAKAEKRGK
jgi:hypothetical protein